MATATRYTLAPDKRGVVWDLVMYLPTVIGLGTGAALFWYGQNANLSYLLFFLACFFFYQGLHRVLVRMMVLPTAPVAIEVSKQQVQLELRGGARVDLVKNVRYFSDYAGKSFGLTGMDLTGAKRQYIFHKGQFAGDDAYKGVGAALKVFA